MQVSSYATINRRDVAWPKASGRTPSIYLVAQLMFRNMRR
jgi:hypothetical protein